LIGHWEKGTRGGGEEKKKKEKRNKTAFIGMHGQRIKNTVKSMAEC